MKFKLCLLICLSFVFVLCAQAADETGRKSRITDVFGYEDDAGNHHHLENSFLDWFHNPAEGVEQGFDVRLRTIWAQDIDTLDDDAVDSSGRNRSRYEFQRYRMRLWHKFMLDEDVDFNMRWVYEFRTWDKPERKNQSWDGDEIIPDRLNVTVRNLFDMPLTMVAGRQDIILGGGWLVLDGTPLDGSRTIYLDALRFTYDMAEQDTTIDAIYVNQGAASDRWLKPINDRNRYVTEQDENAFIFWLTNKSIENTTLEAFYIYKNDNPIDATATNFPAAWSKKARIHTFGGAISGDLDDNWNYRGDAAFQTGKRGANSSSMNELDAFGAKAYLGYSFHDDVDSKVHVAYEFLSGDKPGSSSDEAFDPLWGEWPQFSELLVYTYSREGAIGETTNLSRLNFGHSFKPTKKLTVATDYHLLWADENTSTGSAAFAMDPSEKFRGQLLTCWLKYNCCKKIVAHTVFEYFVPGSYYAKSNRDDAFFLRLNLEYSF